MGKKKQTEFNKKEILAELRKIGAKFAQVRYEGSGDDGRIYSVEIDDDDAGAIDSVVAQYSYGKLARGVDIASALEDFTNQALEDASINYCDNEGGRGDLNIDVVEGTFTIEHEYPSWESCNPIQV